MVTSAEARKALRLRRIQQEMATAAARDLAATIPPMPPIQKRIKGVVVDDEHPEPGEPTITPRRARLWTDGDGKPPSGARTLVKNAQAAHFDTIISWSHGERRGAHGRLLDPPGADFCSVLGRRRVGERFLATWQKIVGANGKPSWRIDNLTPVLYWCPGDHINPRIISITNLKENVLS